MAQGNLIFSPRWLPYSENEQFYSPRLNSWVGNYNPKTVSQLLAVYTMSICSFVHQYMYTMTQDVIEIYKKYIIL